MAVRELQEEVMTDRSVSPLVFFATILTHYAALEVYQDPQPLTAATVGEVNTGQAVYILPMTDISSERTPCLLQYMSVE